jgi:hypothetical protein
MLPYTRDNNLPPRIDQRSSWADNRLKTRIFGPILTYVQTIEPRYLVIDILPGMRTGDDQVSDRRNLSHRFGQSVHLHPVKYSQFYIVPKKSIKNGGPLKVSIYDLHPCCG